MSTGQPRTCSALLYHGVHPHQNVCVLEHHVGRKGGGRRERGDPHLPEGDGARLVDLNRQRGGGRKERKRRPSSFMGEKRLLKEWVLAYESFWFYII